MRTKKSLGLFLSLVITSAAVAATNQAQLPENLGLGLRQIAALAQQDQKAASDRLASSGSIMSDNASRVIVNIYPDGQVSLDDLSRQLQQLGLEIIALDSNWRSGVISAWLPISQAAAVANLAGVRSVSLAPRPRRHVGVVTAESSILEHAAEVNTPGNLAAQGILGRNISVGIVSDSFDHATGVARASVGVAAGDLPGIGNPDGYTTPVVVLKDGTDSSDADEGRAMAEIVHDIAPAAKISFYTDGPTQAAMATAIRTLRTNSQTLCDIIVDDISFGDEPFFSDGVIAQAIKDVANSTTLAGKKVSYFSAAGNNIGGYAADANIISSASAQPYIGNLNFSSVPAALYSGGLQNLNPTGAPAIIISATTDSDTSHELTFQWDDPFNTGGVTTDYNFLVFDQNGVYLSSISGTDNNLSTSQPLEIVDLAASKTYQLVISLRTNSSPTARHLRLLSTGDGEITGPYFSSNVISTFGHATAADANCVAAYVYSKTPNTVTNYNSAKTNPPPGPYIPALEGFSARGGSLPFYFDANGARLASPEIRLKPDFAAADGVDTSFFPAGTGNDYDNDGFPNFFGTSAAAPNAAAFAALLLEAAGGPNSLSPAQVRATLQQTALAHDLDPNFSSATAAQGASSVQLAASGDDSNASAMSPTFFTLTYNGQPGTSLREIQIDLTNANLVFDLSTDLGLPFTVGQNSSGVSVASSLSANRQILTVTLGDLAPGASISFGIDRDYAGINAGGNNADFLAGARLIATLGPDSQKLYGAFANQLGGGFSPADGYGLLDARAAVKSILGTQSSAAGAPPNLSTRGIIAEGDSVLIGGVIITGTAAKKVIFRAIGPSLPVAGASDDPTLDLYDANGQLLASDDNWQDDPTQKALIQQSGIPPADPRESALVETLNPGAYTAIVRHSSTGHGGIGLVEVYDLDPTPSASRLANISTRGSIQSGTSVLIGGFILNQGTARVVVRALGPSLTNAGVGGALPDPTLELHDGNGVLLAANDNWQQDFSQATQIQALGLAPNSATESALDITLPNGAYTAVVAGANGTTGVGLVEVYSIP